jgi:hypothetical protein
MFTTHFLQTVLTKAKIHGEQNSIEHQINHCFTTIVGYKHESLGRWCCSIELQASASIITLLSPTLCIGESCTYLPNYSWVSIV